MLKKSDLQLGDIVISENSWIGIFISTSEGFKFLNNYSYIDLSSYNEDLVTIKRLPKEYSITKIIRAKYKRKENNCIYYLDNWYNFEKAILTGTDVTNQVSVFTNLNVYDF